MPTHPEPAVTDVLLGYLQQIRHQLQGNINEISRIEQVFFDNKQSKDYFVSYLLTLIVKSVNEFHFFLVGEMVHVGWFSRGYDQLARVIWRIRDTAQAWRVTYCTRQFLSPRRDFDGIAAEVEREQGPVVLQCVYKRMYSLVAEIVATEVKVAKSCIFLQCISY